MIRKGALAPVAVPGDGDPLRVGVTHLDDLARRGFDALQHVAVRGAGPEVDVGQHRQVAVADRLDGRSSHPGQARRCAVAMQALEDDPDLLLSREFPSGLSLDLPDDRFRRASLFPSHSFLLAWFCYWKP